MILNSTTRADVHVTSHQPARHFFPATHVSHTTNSCMVVQIQSSAASCRLCHPYQPLATSWPNPALSRPGDWDRIDSSNAVSYVIRKAEIKCSPLYVHFAMRFKPKWAIVLEDFEPSCVEYGDVDVIEGKAFISESEWTQSS